MNNSLVRVLAVALACLIRGGAADDCDGGPDAGAPHCIADMVELRDDEKSKVVAHDRILLQRKVSRGAADTGLDALEHEEAEYVDTHNKAAADGGANAIPDPWQEDPSQNRKDGGQEEWKLNVKSGAAAEVSTHSPSKGDMKSGGASGRGIAGSSAKGAQNNLDGKQVDDDATSALEWKSELGVIAAEPKQELAEEKRQSAEALDELPQQTAQEKEQLAQENKQLANALDKLSQQTAQEKQQLVEENQQTDQENEQPAQEKQQLALEATTPITARWIPLKGGKNKWCSTWADSTHRYEDVSRKACEKKAIENGHTHISYKKTSKRRGKCMTSHGCDGIQGQAGWKIYTAPEPTPASISVEGLWEELEENKRCKPYLNSPRYDGVNSEEVCQDLAISNGHIYYSFKRSNAKCFTAPNCAAKIDRVGWTIYKAPTPTPAPTTAPSSAPTSAPTESPTMAPTPAPTSAPTSAPTESPTMDPTTAPTSAPTSAPTESPTMAPTTAPTSAPTSAPTESPTMVPSPAPTSAPTSAPTESPTMAPTTAPTSAPTSATIVSGTLNFR